MEALWTVRHYICSLWLEKQPLIWSPQNPSKIQIWTLLGFASQNWMGIHPLFVKPEVLIFCMANPGILVVACTDDHRSYRGVLKNHPHPRRNACVGGRGDKYRCCWWLKFCIIWYGQDHCKQWDIPPPSISNLCVFFFRRCFWYSIWNVPSLRQCALLWSAWAWWSGRRSLFLWVMNIILKSVRFTVSTDDLDFKRWKTHQTLTQCMCLFMQLGTLFQVFYLVFGW